MTSHEREILSRTLNTLNAVQVDMHVYSRHPDTVQKRDTLYNYEALGRLMLGRRMLSELLGHHRTYLLPGEYVDYEDLDDQVSEYVPSPRSADNTPLTDKEKRWMIKTLLVVLNGVPGLYDNDDACMRVILREIAEVAGYPELGHYRLLMETDVKPLYFKRYSVHVDFC